MRVFLTIVVPLLLPTLLYFLYLLVVRRRAVGPQGQAAQELPLPWVWLSVIGAALAAITFFAVAQLDGAPPGSQYEPARVIDGKIQPGRFE
jgi:hypothetical protein